MKNPNLDFKEDPIGASINLVIYVLIIYILLQIYWAIKGHSWDPVNILFALMILLIGNTIRTEYRIGKIEGILQGIQTSMTDSFNRIKEDLSKIKK